MIAEKYPLCWPVGYKRTTYPKRSQFNSSLAFGKARDEVFKQLNLMLDYQERKTIILSTSIPLRLDGIPYANYRQPDDKGIALYFTFNKENVVLCCDKWDKVEHNLWAIAKTVENLRGIERWGVSDFLKHSFSGFTALPPPEAQKQKREWWSVFGYNRCPSTVEIDWSVIEQAYRSLAKIRHPDMPDGSTEKFQELNHAYQEAKKYYRV